MDVISHALWGGITFGRKSKKLFLLAFIFGAIPDIFAFGAQFVVMVFGGEIIHEPIAGAIPSYIYTLYNISHSLLVAIVIIALIDLVRREWTWPLLAWPLHIAFDMFTHDLSFFPTPWLWPLETNYISGIPWSTPWVFWMNWAALIILYVVWKITIKNSLKK